MKLHLGCGRKPREGWVNVDMVPLAGVDVVADVSALPFGPESADMIEAQHVIEHIHPLKWQGALDSWFAILKPGGRIVLECPDLQKVCENFASDFGGNRKWWRHCIYGDPENGGSHLNGFTLPQLVADLNQAGFKIEVARTWHDYGEPKLWYNLRVEAVKP